MSCLFPAYVSTNKQQQKTGDESVFGREHAPSAVCVTNDVTPQWLENRSFKSDDALLLHQRHLGQNQRNKSEDSNGEPKQEDTQTTVVCDVKIEEEEKVKDCLESRDGKIHKKKHKRRHLSESPSRKDYRKKHKSHHFSGTTDSEAKKKQHRRLPSPSLGKDYHKKKQEEDQEKKSMKESRESGDRSQHKHKHKHRHRRDRRDEDRTKRREEDKKQEKESHNVKPNAKKMVVIPPGKVFIDDIKDLSPENAFRVDRKPDKVNAEFESIYKMNVAKYRCPKYCLGQSSSQLFISKGDKKSKSDCVLDRYFSKNKLKLIYDDQNVLDLNIDKSSKNSEKFRKPKSESSDFLEITKTKPENSEYNPLGVYDQKTAMYIQGVGGVAAKDVDPPAESSVEGNFKETVSESMKRRTEDFSRCLREKPYDIQMWLEFVKFQDEVLECEMAAERDSGAKSNKGKKQVFLVEKKQAVIDKALQKNPNNVKLQLTKLELHSNVWDSDTMMKEWETLVLSHIGDVTLWKEFLLFVQSSFSRFSVSKVIKQYTMCMRTLRDLQLRKPKYQHVAVPKDIDQHILGIFLQFCYFLKQAGFAEKSIALFQAMIEFNHFMPAVLHQAPREEQVALFEPFWDSCVPRFGDEGAIGWSTWILDKSTNFPPPLVSAVDEDDDDILDKTLPRNQNWLAVEKHREGTFWLPWRPDITKGQGQQDCEDPDRLVLIDDITDFLVTFSEEVKAKLVLSFLSFLGVSNHRVKDSVGKMAVIHKPIQDLPNQMSCPKSSESLDFYQTLNSFPSSDDSILQSFATELFKQVCKLLPTETRQDVTVAWMTSEINRMKNCAGSEKKVKKHLYKEVKKFCKTILQEQSNRSCLELWELYGRFEWCYGSVVDASKVFDMAIGMHCKDVVNLSGSQQLQAVKLCFSYCELILGLHEPRLVLSKKIGLRESQVAHVLYILTCLIGAAEFAVPSAVKNTTPPQMLKAKKHFVDFLKTTLDNFLSALQQNQEFQTLGELAMTWTECYALYQYLGLGIKAAAVVMEETIDKIKPFTITKYTPLSTSGVMKSDISTYFEKLHVSYIKLLTFHLSTTYAPLSILRSPLMRGLQLFPDNPCLLSTFIEMEASSHIAGRVRKYFDHSARSGSITNWFFAIHAELLRKQSLLESLANGDQVLERKYSGKEANPDLGIANRIRSLFEKATASQGGKTSILLWRMFVHFEKATSPEQELSSIEPCNIAHGLRACTWMV
ncbi:nuclear exosome regulator NRDE2-like isoform X2 [Lineus longissimus]|uniref:nuclear exosome regulator NRDE2-like isoform X2 n=1 Tax=Lineus longissimus TaxID=88925 RepID=UPI00315D55BB